CVASPRSSPSHRTPPQHPPAHHAALERERAPVAAVHAHPRARRQGAAAASVFARPAPAVGLHGRDALLSGACRCSCGRRTERGPLPPGPAPCKRLGDRGAHAGAPRASRDSRAPVAASSARTSTCPGPSRLRTEQRALPRSPPPTSSPPLPT
ncbi:hypothetical protein FA09DRAFT_359498, partial [Tilletiopsis washingtonensis]